MTFMSDTTVQEEKEQAPPEEVLAESEQEP